MDPTKPRWAGHAAAADPAAVAYATRLLAALSDAAAHGRVPQADLSDALHVAWMPADPVALQAGLSLLLDRSCVTNPVPLADGGLRLTVTGVPLQAQAGWDDPQDVGHARPPVITEPASRVLSADNF